MIKQENDILIRVNRTKARRLYNAGFPVYMLPCKTRLDNSWIKPARMIKESINYISNDGFNTIVARNDSFETVENAYSYYNCNYQETGKYPAYYIEKGTEV